MDTKLKCIEQARDKAERVRKQILRGEITINQARKEYGLKPINTT